MSRIERRPLCVFAGPPAPNRYRSCAVGVNGGRVRTTHECVDCPKYRASNRGGPVRNGAKPSMRTLPFTPGPLLTVPQPPDLLLTPTQSTAVVTIVIGDEAKKCWKASGPYMKAYAERLGADLVILDWLGHPTWPMSSKFAIPRTLDYYDRIIYADADVLFRPGCLNLFEQCAPDEFGACDEFVWHKLNPQHRREINYQAFRERMGFEEIVHLPWMLNCGVMVIPKSHKHLLLPPSQPIPADHCSEQDHTNARLLESGMKYRLLDRRCNWQFWTDHHFKAAPKDAVLHWSGANPAYRADFMFDFVQELSDGT